MVESNVDSLRAKLAALHAQLELSGGDLPELRAQLLATVSEIERLLASGKLTQSESSQTSIVSRLTEAARHFEESHPTLSGTVGSVIDALAQMGI